MTGRILVAAAAALAVAGGAPAGARGEGKVFVMKVATVAPDGTPWAEALRRWKDRIEKRSGGRIRVRTFLGGTLGDENELVAKCRRGQVEAVGVTTASVASVVPELAVVEIPYLFRSHAEADHVVDHVLTARVEPIFRRYGLVFGYWSENGFRHIGTKRRPVRAPADLKGLKFRAQESPLHLETWKALGAAPVPIPATEVLTAMQTGTVDGLDSAYLYFVAASWHRTIQHFSLTAHIYQPGLVVFHRDWFDGLPADLQAILVEEGRALQVRGRRAIRALDKDLEAIMEREGIRIHRLSAAERRAFEAAAAPVRTWFRRTQGKEAAALLDEIERALEAYRARGR
jgi:TRAP-type transport system periplasmic protein